MTWKARVRNRTRLIYGGDMGAISKWVWEAIRKEILAGIDYNNYAVGTVVDQVAGYRSHAIRLEPRPAHLMLKTGGSGLWLAGNEHDYIFYDMDTALVHQHHIILHELSHMLLGHCTYHVGSDSDVLALICMRNVMEDKRRKEEIEAEALASLMHKAIIQQIRLCSLDNERANTQGWVEIVEKSLHATR